MTVEAADPTGTLGPEILTTDWISWPWENILDCSLDRPAVGPLEYGSRLDLAGWIVGRSKEVRSIRVLVNPFPPDGLPILEMPVSIQREGVLARFEHLSPAQPTGFEAVIGIAGLPADFELVLEAVLEDGATERFASIRGRHGLIESGFSPALEPIMVTSLGRTGTTWLMRLLAEHPQIVVHQVYPYEARACSYWLHAFDVLAEPDDHGLADKDSFHTDRSAVRHNPLHESAWEDPVAGRWLRREYIEQVAQFALRATDSFYRTVGEANGRVEPRCFAEKFHVGHGRWFVRSLYPSVREIVLVRDPRDMFCSILAFNQKRGRQDFGRESVASDAEFVEHLRLDFVRLVDVIDSDADTTHLVRYEDLILRPVRTLAALLEYSGLDASDAMIEQVLASASSDTPELRAHRTAGGARESVGRWRRDLPEELRAPVKEAFGPILSRLGYDSD